MNEQDEADLLRMCNLTELPDNVRELCREFQRVQHRYQGGPLIEASKQLIAVLCGFGKKSEADNIQRLEYDWEKVPEGSRVTVFEGDSRKGGIGNIYNGTFVSVLRGDDFGFLEIKIRGSNLPFDKVDHRDVEFNPDTESTPVVQTTEDQAVDFTSTDEEFVDPNPADPGLPEAPPVETPKQTSTWDTVEIGTKVVVATDEGQILYGKLHRVPKADSKHAGILYIDVDGDEKKYRQFNEDEVKLGVTTNANV